MGASEQEPDPGAGRPSSTSPLSGASLGDLPAEVVERVQEVLEDQRRLRLLLDAVVAIAADLSTESLLGRIVELASELAGARYAALGVLGTGAERRLRAFIYHGLSEEQRLQIGDLPRGHGLLGQIIDDPRPLRLLDIAGHAQSFGFPANHPPMHSFLGVPVRIKDRVFGNLYLTEKTGGGEFTEQDEEIVVALAAAAGVVIENARLYEDRARRETWLAATARITTLLTDHLDDTDSLQSLADLARDAGEADVAVVVVPGDSGRLTLRTLAGVAAGADPGRPVIGLLESLAARVVSRSESVKVDDLDRQAGAGPPGPSWPELGPAVLVPLRAPGGVDGALGLAWSPERREAFRELDPRMPEQYAEQAALAMQAARARRDQERLAVFEDRDRIGRDLHDLVIQRLFAIGLSLERAVRTAGQPDVSERVERAVDDVDETIKEIRRSIFALSAGPESTDVRATLADLVGRSAKVLGFRPSLTFEGPVNAAVGPRSGPHLAAVLGEALTNVSRHAHAGRVWVTLSAGEQVVLTVRDDGRGIGSGTPESGLRNMRERAEELGGTCLVEPAPGGGTVATWQVPAQ